jgi:peroxin-1
LAAGLDPLSKKNALLLSANTEVSIAPKLHSNKQTSPPKNPLVNSHSPMVKNLSVNGVSTEPTTSSKDDFTILRVLPVRLLPDIQFPRYSNSDSLAYVSPVTFARVSKSSADSFYCGQFRPLVSPADSTVTPLPLLQNPDPVLARLGGSGGSNVASSRSGKVWIGTSKGLLAGHIVFFVLPKGVDEWGLVRYAASHV